MEAKPFKNIQRGGGVTRTEDEKIRNRIPSDTPPVRMSFSINSETVNLLPLHGIGALQRFMIAYQNVAD